MKLSPFVIFAITEKAASFFRFINIDKAITFDPEFILNLILCQHRLPKLKNYWN